MRVGFLGPEGTFSHEAVAAAGVADLALVPQPTLHAAVMAVHEGAVDRSLVPIENSHEGAVNPTLDALAFATSDVEIVGEVVHPVHHCLVAREPLEPGAVRTVLSHPQASAQCAGFLRAQLPAAAVVAAASTAEAVRALGAGPPMDGPVAALGTRLAAELYGCVVLRGDVEDDPANETRFVWVARAGAEPQEPRPAADAYKTSLFFWGPGSARPGWLVHCLAEFASRGVNLTRIESRPRRQGLGEYMFYLDLVGSASDPAVGEAIERLRVHAEVVRVLGSFPAA
jgi:prephenate dehydratase